MKKLLIMVVFMCLLVSACGGSGGGSGDGSSNSEHNLTTGEGKIAFSESSSVDIIVSFSEDDSTYRAKEQGIWAEVKTVILDVKDDETYYIKEQVLTKSGATWSGTLSDLPIGPMLTFIARAYDSSEKEILQGSTDQILTGNNDLINISLSPIYDEAFLLPKISLIQITPSAQLEVSQTAKILVSVEGNSEETLSYQLSAGKNSGGENRNTGTFKPLSGKITLQENTGIIEIDYHASVWPGTYLYTIAVTNEQNNSVETDFEITVDSSVATEPIEDPIDTSNPQINLRLAPVITSLKAKQSGSTIIWTAIVDKGTAVRKCMADKCTVDNCAAGTCTVGASTCTASNCTADNCANGGLKYYWTFDGGLEFKDSSANPAIMLNYNASVQGTLTLTVQGCGGSTTISYNLPIGQFPDLSGDDSNGTNGSSDSNGSDDSSDNGDVSVEQGEEIVLQSDLSDVQDIWISNQYDNNEDNKSKLKVGKLGENKFYSLIRFNLDGLPENISSAIMYLYCFHTTNPNGNSNSYGIVNINGDATYSSCSSNVYEKNPTSMYVDMITSPWDVNTNWFNKPSSMKIAVIPAPVSHSWVAIDITPLYRKWKMGGVVNYGIQLHLAQNGNGVNEFYSSSFMENESLRPKLVVTP